VIPGCREPRRCTEEGCLEFFEAGTTLTNRVLDYTFLP